MRQAIRERGLLGLTAEEARIKDEGLVLILNELHERLDAEVAAAYGWDAALPEAEILLRLVALNKTRLAEEARGKVHWLRPEYQIPRFGSALQKLDLAGEMREAAPGIAPRRAFPANEVAQTAEIMAVLATAAAPLSAGDILDRFKPSKTVRPKVDAVLDGLIRMGIVRQAMRQYSLTRGS